MRVSSLIAVAGFIIAAGFHSSAPASNGAERSGLPMRPPPLYGPIEGKSYCRTVETGGMFGQPKGKRSHCVSFNEGIATDNANTFFGNPPTRKRYFVNGDQVKFGDSLYVMSEDFTSLTTVKGSAVEGTVLTLREQ